IKPGQITHELTSSLDLFPTIMKFTGTPLYTNSLITSMVPGAGMKGTIINRPYDGFDMSGILFGGGKNQREVMFYYNGNQLYAARKGPFKAHFATWPGYSKEKPEKHEVPVLYNVEEDPGEKFDIAAQHPDVIADIQREVEKHRAGMVPGKPQY